MVHYLMFADQGAHRSALDRFTALTLEGKTSAAATEIAFGNPQALENGFSQYINRQVMTFMHFDVDVSVKPRAVLAARAVGRRSCRCPSGVSHRDAPSRGGSGADGASEKNRPA